MIENVLTNFSEAGLILGSTYIALKLLPMYFQVQLVPELDLRESLAFQLWSSRGESQ